MTAADLAVEIVDLLEELRLPDMCRTAAELLATAEGQRWGPPRPPGP